MFETANRYDLRHRNEKQHPGDRVLDRADLSPSPTTGPTRQLTPIEFELIMCRAADQPALESVP